MKIFFHNFRLLIGQNLKRVAIFLLTLFLSSFTKILMQSKAPKEIVTAFNLKFPKATNVKWYKETATEYEASFKYKNTKHSANFSSDGKWLETESPITFNDLPIAVQKAFSVSHKNEKTKAIAVIENSKGETLYEIEVKKVEYFYNSDGTLHS
jgi:hypothetical protein